MLGTGHCLFDLMSVIAHVFGLKFLFPWWQALLRECRGLHGDLEAMGDREECLGEVLQTEGWGQQVKHLSRRTEELQQNAKTRLQSLQDAAKVNVIQIYSL